MKLFADTANISAIQELNERGLLDGVTTNPSLLSLEKENPREIIEAVCGLVDGSVSVEVANSSYAEMVREGEEFAGWAKNVTIKLPLTWDGLKACRYFRQRGQDTNVTLCFSVNQALLAAKAGATYISPFVGRIDDLGADGVVLVRDIRGMLDRYKFSTQLLAASIRSPKHVAECSGIGADVITCPPAVIRKLVQHPLTESGLEIFERDRRTILARKTAPSLSD